MLRARLFHASPSAGWRPDEVQMWSRLAPCLMHGPERSSRLQGLIKLPWVLFCLISDKDSVLLWMWKEHVWLCPNTPRWYMIHLAHSLWKGSCKPLVLSLNLTFFIISMSPWIFINLSHKCTLRHFGCHIYNLFALAWPVWDLIIIPLFCFGTKINQCMHIIIYLFYVFWTYI